jgi:hypothetical protein
MDEQAKPDDRFVETIAIGENTLVHHNGTFAELNALAPSLRAAPPLRAAPGTKVDDVIKVLTFTWDIVKDSNAKTATEGACTRILCAQDDNWVNYENARDFASEEVKYKLDNFAGVNCYTVNFKVVGTYQARHPTLGGQWMPVVHVGFTQCHANWPWWIDGKATIDATNVSNMKTREDPVPQIVLVIKITTNAKFAFNWESHERSFIFNVNGQDGVKPI